MEDISIFRNRIDVNNINSDIQLREELLKQKIIHNKYRYKIQKMNTRELKNFVYTGKYVENEFEGIGLLFISVHRNDLKTLVKHIIKIKIDAINILRLFIFTLSNLSLYEGTFLTYLKYFKINYEKKFKGLLFELGQQYKIDKLDLINLFKRLLIG